MTRYPLSIQFKAGREVMERFGMMTEAPTRLVLEAVDVVADRVVSAHAPYSTGCARLSIADLDDAVREVSIDQLGRYIEAAATLFPNLQKVNMHSSPRRWVSGGRTLVGDYDRLIDGVRHLAGIAGRYGLELVLENNRTYWEGVPGRVPADRVNREAQNEYFGTAPEEWMQIQADVDRSNVFLCLDPSHACTYAHTFVEVEKRRERMMAFLNAGEALRHVHWNGNDLESVKGRQDMHMCIGADTLPRAFHRAVKGLDATLLLEHFYSVEELEAELGFIERL